MNVEEHDFFNTDNPRRFKIYLVEIDDDNRERVISATAERIGLSLNNEFETIYSEEGPVMNIPTYQTAEVELRLVPSEEGYLFKWEDWINTDEDEEEE